MGGISLRDGMSLLAAAGNLSLAVIAAIAGRKSTLARPLAALCFVLFGWNFSVLAQRILRGAAGIEAFSVLDSVFTALSPLCVLAVVLSFIGETRRYRAVRFLAALVFGALALASLGGFFSAVLLAWTDSVSWSIIFLSGWGPTVVFEVVVLGRYLRRAGAERERARARIVLAALALGSAFSMSDVAHGVGLPVPYLGALGTFIAAALLTGLVVRLELLDRNVSLRTSVYVLGMIVAFVVAYLVVLSVFAGRLAAQVFGGSVLALLVAAVARELALSAAETRERTDRLVVLGRFSAQMAHDIRGPLTALVGAVDVLDHAAGAGDQRELFDLAREQARRIGRIVDRYDRMARVEPQMTLVRVNELVRSVARVHGVENAQLEDAEIECEGDRALLESAIENVVRNAVEAARSAALVRLESRLDLALRMAVIRVSDEGPGMDARVLARATSDFFTTKPNGSGLGLAFARRVLEAHGGSLTLASEHGKGTSVELRFPLAVTRRHLST